MATFDLTDYSGSAAMSKSVAVGATLGITTSFTVGFTSAYDGQMKLSLGSTTSTRKQKVDMFMMFGSRWWWFHYIYTC